MAYTIVTAALMELAALAVVARTIRTMVRRWHNRRWVRSLRPSVPPTSQPTTGEGPDVVFLQGRADRLPHSSDHGPIETRRTLVFLGRPAALAVLLRGHDVVMPVGWDSPKQDTIPRPGRSTSVSPTPLTADTGPGNGDCPAGSSRVFPRPRATAGPRPHQPADTPAQTCTGLRAAGTGRATLAGAERPVPVPALVGADSAPGEPAIRALPPVRRCAPDALSAPQPLPSGRHGG